MRYIALLRGINVGGNTMVKMSDLSAMFESLGYKNVKTYINSGNIAFDSAKTAEAKLIAKIENAIEEKIGKRVSVMLREQKDIDRVLANNPFDGEFESHKEMHVLFMRSDLPEEKIRTLAEAVPTGERFSAIGREIYCHLPMGVAESYLGRGQFEKMLKVSMTARNWRTVEKLAEL